MVSEARLLASTYALAEGRKRRNIRKGLSHDEMQEYFRQRLKETMPAIMAKAEEQAMEGDKDARTWLWDRTYGKAAQSVEIQGHIEHHYEGQVNVAVLAAQAALELKKGKT